MRARTAAAARPGNVWLLQKEDAFAYTKWNPMQKQQASSSSVVGQPSHKVLALLLLGVTCILMMLVWGSSPARPTGSNLTHAVTQMDRNNRAQLLLVQVVFRHGARTPLSLLYWPDEPYSDCSMAFPGARLRLVDEAGSGQEMALTDLGMAKLPGGCRMGQLTATGFGMAKDLGAYLRKLYVQELGLLSPTWQAEQVWARTTRYHRTMQTLQGVLTGLWPDLASEAAPQVQVAASAETDEYAYGSNGTCTKLGPLLLGAQRIIEERDTVDSKLAALAAEAAAALALPGGPASIKWVRLYDTLAAMQAHPGSRLPAGLTDALFAAVMEQGVRHEADVIAPFPGERVLPNAQCREVLQLSIGPLLWHLQQNMLVAAGTTADQQRGQLLQQHGAGAGANHSGNPDSGKGVGTVRGGGGGSRQREHLGVAGSEERLGVEDAEERRRAHAAAQRLGQEGHSHKGGLSQGHDASVRQRVLAGARAPLSNTGPASAGRRLFLFSGHDATITPLLGALGVYETDWPPFTSNFVFELWRVSSTAAASDRALWVRIFLDRKPLDVSHITRAARRAGDEAAGGRYRPSEGWLHLTDLTAYWKPLVISVPEKRAACQ